MFHNVPDIKHLLNILAKLQFKGILRKHPEKSGVWSEETTEEAEGESEQGRVRRPFSFF